MINHIHIEFPQIRGISNGRIICACYPHLSACKSAHFPHIQKVRGNFNSHKGKTEGLRDTFTDVSCVVKKTFYHNQNFTPEIH